MDLTRRLLASYEVENYIPLELIAQSRCITNVRKWQILLWKSPRTALSFGPSTQSGIEPIGWPLLL
jgi:hypothetical protein